MGTNLNLIHIRPSPSLTLTKPMHFYEGELCSILVWRSSCMIHDKNDWRLKILHPSASEWSCFALAQLRQSSSCMAWSGTAEDVLWAGSLSLPCRWILLGYIEEGCSSTSSSTPQKYLILLSYVLSFWFLRGFTYSHIQKRTKIHTSTSDKRDLGRSRPARRDGIIPSAQEMNFHSIAKAEAPKVRKKFLTSAQCQLTATQVLMPCTVSISST